MRALIVFLSLCVGASASAQGAFQATVTASASSSGAETSAQLRLDVRVAELNVPRLVAKLEADLQTRITSDIDVTGPLLVVDVDAPGTLIIRYRNGSETRERRATPEGNVDERALTIALLASNLVRDEASELLVMLRERAEPPDRCREHRAAIDV